MTNLQKLIHAMVSPVKYSLRFFLRKSKKDPTRGMIYIRMTYENEKPIDLGSTGFEGYFKNFEYFIPHDKQDIEREVKNKAIVAIILKIKKTIEELHPTTSNYIRSVLNEKIETNFNVIRLLNRCLEECEDIRELETKKSWRSKIIKLESYLIENKMNEVLAERFNCIMMNNYIDSLKSEGLQGSTISKHRDVIMKAMRWGASKGVINNNPLRDFKMYGVKVKKQAKKALTWDLIIDLSKYKFEGREQRAVDMFIFSCCTGMSYIDMKNMSDELSLEMEKQENGEYKYFVNTERQKVKTATFRVELDGFSLDIFSKYNDLKEICSIDNSSVNKIIKSCFEHIGLDLKICKKITFHSARHTFITYCRKEKGYSDEDIMSMSGHQDRKNMYDYIYIDEKRSFENLIRTS